MKTFYEIECDGKKIEGIGHSFTRWGLNILSSFFFFSFASSSYSQNYSMKSTANVDFTIPNNTTGNQRGFGSSTSSYIVQGTSNQAFDWTQHNLISPVTLTTVQDVVPSYTAASSAPFFVSIRHETLRCNATANPITIREIGLTGYVLDNAGNARTFLVCRDVLTEAVTIPVNANIRIRYTFRFES